VLLHCWGHDDPPRDLAAGTDDAEDQYLVLYERGGAARLWAQHEQFLRSKAAEWGWKPKPRFTLGGVAMFYGEYVTNGGEEI
jgi:hypothetical protein